MTFAAVLADLDTDWAWALAAVLFFLVAFLGYLILPHGKPKAHSELHEMLPWVDREDPPADVLLDREPVASAPAAALRPKKPAKKSVAKKPAAKYPPPRKKRR